MKYHTIQNDLKKTCRSCLNQEYGLNLKPKDCLYEDYPYVCQYCGEVKNIVNDIRFRKKMLFPFL